MRRHRTPRLLRLPIATLVAFVAVTGLPAPHRAAQPEVEVRDAELLPPGLEAAAPGWTKRVSPPIDAQMVGFTWNGDDEGAVQVRAQLGDGWTPWFDLHAAPDEVPDAGSPEGGGSEPGSVAAGPVWLGDGVDDVEVRVEHGKLRDLRLHAIRSVPPAAGWTIESAGAVPAKPGILAKEQWGSGGWVYTNSGCSGGPRSARPRYAIVHHTVTGNSYSSSQVDDVIRGIYAFHTQTRGWCDIAYNFVIDRFGRTWEARSGGVDEGIIGGHAKGFNTGSIGVALLGQHQPGIDPPAAYVSTESKAAVRKLLAWKFGHHGIDGGATIKVTSGGSTRYAAGTVVSLPTIIGHRDVGVTSCPGDYAYPITWKERRPVQSDVMRSRPYPLPGWVPSASGAALIAVDAFGGLHPLGASPEVKQQSHWPGFAIVRSATRVGAGGYVLDGWGGLHPFNGAPKPYGTPWWEGWDIARDVTAGRSAGGYVLDGWGALHPFNGESRLIASGYWRGHDVARGVDLNSDGLSGYTLDRQGGLHPIGIAHGVRNGPWWPDQDVARDVVLLPGSTALEPSGYVLDKLGGVHPFGSASKVKVNRYTPGQDTARSLVVNSAGTGGWILDRDGYVWPFGSETTYPTRYLSWAGTSLGRALVDGA